MNCVGGRSVRRSKIYRRRLDGARPGEMIYIECKDDFYGKFVSAWYVVQSVDDDSARLKVTRNNEVYKIFENQKGICFIIEHEYNKYGESTWSDAKQCYAFIYVSIAVYRQ